MKLRFTIGRKIGLGFGIIIILTTIAFLLTNITLNDSRKKTDQVTEIFNPSVASLKELDNLLNRSKLLITKWFYVQTGDDAAHKKALRNLLDQEYPTVKEKIKKYSVNWNKDEQESIEAILSLVERMFKSYKEDVMATLNSFDTYNDSNIKFVAQLPFEDLEPQFQVINENLSKLIDKQNSNATDNSDEMLRSFSLLQKIVVWLGIILVFGGILIAIYTVRSIVRPIQQLKKILLSMGRGVLPTERIKDRNDEIGEMSIALNDLVDGMARTTQFAKQVGSGNFDSHYRPLSKDDTLGAALLKMREDLRENERVLEAKVIERTEEVVRQKEEIETKNQELEVLYKHVTDSIKYAKRIQEAILPPDSLVKRVLPNSFVLYKPKDIVSGDFYWIDEKNGKTMFAAVDCTGHGVPGAFMSIVGYNILKHSVNNNNFTTPSLILDALNQGVSETLHHGHEESQAKDGMDLSFCTIDYAKMELQYAGAFNPLYLIREGQLIQTKADKFPIGLFLGEEKKKFTNHSFQLMKGDVIYIFSDGYADQFGGPNGKKFMANHFRDLLLDVHKHPIDKQKDILNKTIEEWRGPLDQVDDILVIGVKIE
ncbi:MAG: narX [Bacteroidota bacterium]|jgi:serine phosphatase RsbU (regulator of sigma subunit)/CHASE3 domain sensor protein|nr:narX [Bacteroidota bacterium]